MKIAANAIDSFINNQINKLDAALLYGPDNGLTTVRKTSLSKKSWVIILIIYSSVNIMLMN